MVIRLRMQRCPALMCLKHPVVGSTAFSWTSRHMSHSFVVLSTSIPVRSHNMRGLARARGGGGGGRQARSKMGTCMRRGVIVAVSLPRRGSDKLQLVWAETLARSSWERHAWRLRAGVRRVSSKTCQPTHACRFSRLVRPLRLCLHRTATVGSSWVAHSSCASGFGLACVVCHTQRRSPHTAHGF